MSGDAHGDIPRNTVGNGRYRLRGLLGEGGMASVYTGYDTVLERLVAVKTLHSELGRESAFRERFRREAMAVAKLNHSNIVSVYDSGEDEVDGRSVPFIVMEMVDGKPLRQVLDEDMAKHGAMPVPRALKITADVLAALAVSHEAGLVHRDIKPGNVMLTRRNVVKVMDFGIARALQSGVKSMTQTGMVVGTPQYLSPEQALGRGVDARSDLYSVGCMLFELLTGRLPFDGESPLSVAYQHVQEEPPLPSSINRALPPAVDALVVRALRKNPADRFPTAEAMQEECERIVVGLGGGTGGAGTPLVINEGPRVQHSPQTPGPQAGPHTPRPQMPGPQAGPHTPRPQAGPHTPRPNGGFSAFPQPPGPPPTPPPGSRPTPGPPRTPPPGSRPTPGPPPTPPPYPYAQQALQTPQARQAPQASPGQAVPRPYRSSGNYQTPPPIPGHRPAPNPVQRSEFSTPSTPSGGHGRTPLIIGGAIVAVFVLLGVIGALSGGGKGGSGSSGGMTPTASASAPAVGGGVVQGDQSRTVDPSTCTQANRGFTTTGKGQVIMPDLTFKYVDSVTGCLNAAGWHYTIKHQDEQVWGKGTVLSQSPTAYATFNPTKTAVTLYVSTGEPS